VFTAFSDYFDYYYTTYLPLLVLLYELDLQVCKQEEPALVLLSNEYGGYERALIMAAHAQHIPSLAIQHGIIDEYKAGYMFAANDVSTTGSAHYPFVPIPTNTTVYGSFTKDLLTRSSSFPDNAVVVTGQPRYDSLLHVERLYDKTRFCNRFQIDQQKKLVLITTQPFPMESVREKFILSTIKALNQIQGIQIIVKPHHNETQEWYENRVKTQNIIILPPRYDTYEALYACDLLIAQTSTTILEAMILEKEVVVVNLSNLPEVLPWVEEKAVFGVYNEADLVKNFQSALFDKKAQMATQKDRRTFLTKHIFKTDGKSSERVAARILSLLQEKES